MNLKKILLISIIALAVICSFNIVCAEESHLDGWKTIDFNGFKFNIPGDFQEVNPNDTGLSFWEPDSSSDASIEYKSFRNSSHSYVNIGIISSSRNLTLDDVDDICNKEILFNRTINGKPGLISDDGKAFFYVENGKIIKVCPWDQDIENIIVK